VLHAYAAELIARGRERRDDDVLSALVAARPGGRRLQARELRSHVLGLLLAGNETTAAALSWMLVHAAGAPGWWATLRGRPEVADDFVTESLRLHPPAWGLIRTPTAGGVKLHTADRSIPVRRPGVVTVYIRGMHRDPAVWPDPTRFDPSRHAESAAAARQMIPFGLGPRGCIGQHLALAELRALAPTLARRGDVVTAGVVEEAADFALRPRGGLRGRFTAPAGVAVPPATRR
jgi:pentalenene oxygenase